MRCSWRPGEHHLLRQPGANRVLGALGVTAPRLREIRTRRRRKTDSNRRSPPKTGGFCEQASSTPPAGKTSRNRGIRPERDGGSNPSSSSGESKLPLDDVCVYSRAKRARDEHLVTDPFSNGLPPHFDAAMRARTGQGDRKSV